MKKFLSILLAICMTIGMGIQCAMAENDISVILDGKTLSFDVPPQIINERTMVPMRAIFEALGATVDWNGNDQSITSTKGNTEIKMTISNATMTVSGSPITLDSPPVIIDGRTLVPARAIAEAMSCNVDWDGETRQVKITSGSNVASNTSMSTDGKYQYGISYSTFTDVTGIDPKYDPFEGDYYTFYSYDAGKSDYDKYVNKLISEGFALKDDYSSSDGTHYNKEYIKAGIKEIVGVRYSVGDPELSLGEYVSVELTRKDIQEEKNQNEIASIQYGISYPTFGDVIGVTLSSSEDNWYEYKSDKNSIQQYIDKLVSEYGFYQGESYSDNSYYLENWTGIDDSIFISYYDDDNSVDLSIHHDGSFSTIKKGLYPAYGEVTGVSIKEKWHETTDIYPYDQYSDENIKKYIQRLSDDYGFTCEIKNDEYGGTDYTFYKEDTLIGSLSVSTTLNEIMDFMK